MKTATRKREWQHLAERANKLERTIVLFMQHRPATVECERKMNNPLLLRFTPEILQGADSLAIDRAALAQILGVSKTRLAAMFAAKARLTAMQAQAVVDRSGQSVRKLILRGMEHTATPKGRAENALLMRETFELMTTLDSLDAPAPTGPNGRARRSTKSSNRLSRGKTRAA
jgi:hypothetical protein